MTSDISVTGSGRGRPRTNPIGRRSSDVRVHEELRKSQEELERAQLKLKDAQRRLEAAEKERDLAFQRNEALLDLYINAADPTAKPRGAAVSAAAALKDLTLGPVKTCVRCGSGGLVYKFEEKLFCRSCLGKEHPLLS